MTQGPVGAVPRIHLAADPPMQPVTAGGGGVVFTLVVTNLTDDQQSQDVTVEGIPSSWVAINFDASRPAFSREQRNAIVTITVPEGTYTSVMSFRAVATAGEHRSTTDCVLQIDGVTPEVDEIVEDVEGRPPPPGLDLSPPVVSLVADGDTTSELRLSVRNVGGRETVYSLVLTGLEPTWFSLPEKIRVSARETIDNQLVLRPPMSANSGVYPFSLRATVDAAPEVFADIIGELTVLAPEAEPTEPEEPEPSQQRASAVAAAVPPELRIGPDNSFRFGPGEVTTDATLTIENRSRLLEGYSLSVDGLPDGWFTLPIRELRLEPGATRELPLRLTPKPGSRNPAGDYPFRVRVAPHGAPEAFAESGAMLSIVGTAAFDARVAPLQAQGRHEKYKVTLRNTGTQPISLWIEGADPQGMCRFEYPAPPNLEPGEERVLPVKVAARRNRFVGNSRTFDFGLRVLPAGGESSQGRNFDARLIHQPFLSPRILKWTLIAAVLIVILGILISLGPGRFLDGGDWFRCRFNSTRPYCRPNTAPLRRLEQWPPPIERDVGLASLAALSNTRPAARRSRASARRNADDATPEPEVPATADPRRDGEPRLLL